MYSSQNQFVAMISAHSATDARSLINRNMQVISEKYSIDLIRLLHNNVPSHALDIDTTETCAAIVNILKELRGTRECTYAIPGFSAEEIRFMYEFTSTF